MTNSKLIETIATTHFDDTELFRILDICQEKLRQSIRPTVVADITESDCKSISDSECDYSSPSEWSSVMVRAGYVSPAKPFNIDIDSTEAIIDSDEYSDSESDSESDSNPDSDSDFELNDIGYPTRKKMPPNPPVRRCRRAIEYPIPGTPEYMRQCMEPF